MLHTEPIHDQRSQWEDRGYAVSVEDQNGFRLQGTSASLAGKHDLIAANDEEDIIIDVKTGQQDPFHAVQVMIYLYAVPNSFPTALAILAPSITRPLLQENQQSRYYPARLIPTFTSQRNNKAPIIIPCATEHLEVTQ